MDPDELNEVLEELRIDDDTFLFQEGDSTDDKNSAGVH